MGQLEGMQSTRQKFQEFLTGSHPGNNFLDPLALRRGLGVSDPRDMIYAHLGVASDPASGDKAIEVNYTKSITEVFSTLHNYFLLSTGITESLVLLKTLIH